MDINVGDFIITKEKQLFRIVEIVTNRTGTSYDVKSLQVNPDYEYYYGQMEEFQYIRGIPEDRLKDLGKVLSQEKAAKILKILYG